MNRSVPQDAGWVPVDLEALNGALGTWRAERPVWRLRDRDAREREVAQQAADAVLAALRR